MKTFPDTGIIRRSGSHRCRRHLRLWMLLLPVFSLSPLVPARAEGAPPSDRLQLTASASKPVTADRLLVRLYAQAEGRELGRVADEVNRRIRKAVERAQREPAVKVETQGYSTSPIYRNRRQEGWRVRQVILLRSPDLATLGTLLGRLQEELALEGMVWELSPQLREQVLAGLREEAVARFRDKAQAMAAAFGYRGYRLVQASVNDGGQGPRPVPYRAMEMKAGGVQPPTLVPGEQSLSVTISGTVWLIDSTMEDSQ